MSISSRRDKIQQAANTVIILHSNGGLDALVAGSEREYRVTTRRIGPQTIQFKKREITAICYQTDCQCEGNKHQSTCCYHVLAAYQEAMRLAGFVVYKCDRPQDTFRLMNLGYKFVKLISNGGGVVTLAINRHANASQRDAMLNLKRLLNERRIALVNSGDVQPIAWKVELFRRSDGLLAFKSGAITSGPIALFGRDLSSQAEAEGVWKLHPDAERNWTEFIEKILPQQMTRQERVDLLRGKKEERWID